ncbi:MAG TPA: sugar kinase [Bryobacteraceae bacterium]|nr:sugar kinase [Bryobacteraceae bacterium]
MNPPPKPGRRWDLIALGEVMLRLDPGDRRIATARRFDVHEGGGEYNVARGLKRCFGMDTAIVTALADNPIGRLIQDLIFQGGVDQSFLRWVEYDGVGRSVRNGLNFTERGFGVRAALGCSDRANSAASQIKPGDFDWDAIFSHGARWFHTGGIFAGLSPATPEVVLQAIHAAKRHGAIVSYDLNYRPSLWQASGGLKQAQAVNRRIAPLVDVLIGNEGVLAAALGFHASSRNDVIAEIVREFVIPVVAATIRQAAGASCHDWGAILYSGGQFYQAPMRNGLAVYDRIGGGDAFVSGLVYGLLAGHGLQWAVECGAAHGALALTTPGDNSMATLDEVLRLMQGQAAHIAR